MEDLSDMVYPHIDYFIHIGRSGWDIDCFSFDGDPIYDIEGNFEIRNAKVFTLEGCFLYVDNQYIWHPSDDIITNLFHPPRDGLSQ
jgi:hypothetical protein